jgi:hypothetical protein
VSGRLDLRRGIVVSVAPLLVEIEGVRRPAWVDEAQMGETREGDEVVVNAGALELGLGSGGFDVVHVNLTRGLGSRMTGDAHVMKLNYTSLQHPVEPVEEVAYPERGGEDAGASAAAREDVSVAVLPLHGHLAPATWAAAEARPGIRVGYVQTAGGALPGSLSRDVVELTDRGLLCGHVTAAPSYGGRYEALSTVGALHAAVTGLGWDAALVGPGPGIIGSDTAFGHGGMAALDNAHAALSLRLPTLISPRLSSADPRARHRGLSHHTATVLELLLVPVDVAIPEDASEASSQIEAAGAGRHHLRPATVDLDGYASSGLPTTTMGRLLADDPLFFEAPLAAGRLIASPASRGGRGSPGG